MLALSGTWNDYPTVANACALARQGSTSILPVKEAVQKPVNTPIKLTFFGLRADFAVDLS